MNRTLIIVGVIVLVAILLYSSCKGNYNTMVQKDQNTQSQWANVESQYQRRSDLYANVVNTIKGSATFEKQTLTQVIEARAKATQVTANVDPAKLTPESIAQFQQAQDNLSSSMSRLLVTVERYPDLKTTQAFSDFQAQIEGTENRINKSRDDFNAAVQDFNTYIKSFPRNLYAGMFGFTAKGYFKAAAGTANPAPVEFPTTY